MTGRPCQFPEPTAMKFRQKEINEGEPHADNITVQERRKITQDSTKNTQGFRLAWVIKWLISDCYGR